MGEPTPKRAKSTLSANKIISAVFWDENENIFIHYFDKYKKKTITVKFYAILLQNLRDEVKKKLHHLANKTFFVMLMLQHNSQLLQEENSTN